MFSILLCLIVAAIHIAILALEMFLWTSHGPKVFKGLSPQFFETTKALAANQGLYNGFLAAGLIWATLMRPDAGAALFFLACVFVAGLYGAATVSRTILYVQSAPAAVAILSVLIFGL